MTGLITLITPTKTPLAGLMWVTPVVRKVIVELWVRLGVPRLRILNFWFRAQGFGGEAPILKP